MKRACVLRWSIALGVLGVVSPAWAGPPAQGAPNHADAVKPRASPAAIAKPPPNTASASSAATKAAPVSPLRAATQALRSADPIEVRNALEMLAAIGGEPAAKAIAARLQSGLPPALIAAAIDSLVQIGSRSPAGVLLELALHKRAAVREQAIAALAAIGARGAALQPVLLAALDDPTPEVRRAAVDALGAVGNAKALPALFRLAERAQPGALEAIGQLAGPRDLERVLALAADRDVSVVKPALQALMTRPQWPVGAKLGLVAALAKLASPSARACLVEWLDEAKTSGHPRVRQALFEAIRNVDQAASASAALNAKTTTKTDMPGAEVARVETQRKAPPPASEAAAAEVRR